MITMTNMLTAIEESTRRLQAYIARLQGKEALITDRNLELLTRRSQQVAIRCRELWAAHQEDYISNSVAPMPGDAYVSNWSVVVPANDLVEITLPLLLPKRTCPDAAFVTEPLEQLLNAHQADLPRFRQCYVLFRHIYGSELTVRDIRDHDNYESRKVLNTIERHLLTSDSGLYITTIHQTARGGKTQTVILLAGSPNHLEGVLRDEIAQRFPDS